MLFYMTTIHEIRLSTVAYLGFHFGVDLLKFFFIEKWGHLHGVKPHAACDKVTHFSGGFGGMVSQIFF